MECIAMRNGDKTGKILSSSWLPEKIFYGQNFSKIEKIFKEVIPGYYERVRSLLEKKSSLPPVKVNKELYSCIATYALRLIRQLPSGEKFGRRDFTNPPSSIRREEGCISTFFNILPLFNSEEIRQYVQQLPEGELGELFSLSAKYLRLDILKIVIETKKEKVEPLHRRIVKTSA